MRKIKLTVTCLLLSMMVNAQSPVLGWAKKMGGNASDRGMAIAVDGSGNAYSTGYFDGTVDFDPGAGTFNLSSAGNDDVFISKLDASGNFVWAKKMGGTLYEQGMSIAVDGSGNVYIAGYFQGTADFDPGAATFNLTSAGSDDIFVSKLDASGNFVWAKKMGGTGSDYGYSIAVDGSGNVYTTGYFIGTADFDPGAGTFNLTVAGTSDIFISKLDASGNFAWAKQLAGNSSNRGFSIALDGTGNIYTTGIFNGTADFDPGAGVFNLTSAGGADVFISKSDVSGNFVWAKQMGGVSDDIGYSIVIDGSGNVHTTGRFIGTADFDPGAAAFNLTAAGGNDIYVSKLNASGNFVWAKKMGGTSTDAGSSIALDPSGNVYTTGYFSGTADFDPGAATFNLTSATFEIYISKLNSSGNFVWAGALGGTGSDQGYALALDAQGNIYSTGNFSGTADFDPGAGTFNLIAAGPMDIYVHKMSQCIPPSATITPGGSTTFCTGGNVVLNANTGTGYTYQWKLNTVNISGATNISYTASAAGSYTVVVTNSCGSATSSPVTVTVNSLPAAAITPSGSAAFCTGGSVLLQATTGTGFTYQWKKNTLNISGATAASYSANTAGSYTVVITNSCGPSTSPAVAVTENPAPTATITANGPVSFCAGGSVMLSANTGAGYVYQWKNGGANIAGATAQTYTATTTGNYTVQITSAGCTAVSNAISVAVQSTLTPTITETSVVYCPSTTVRLETITGSGYAYQWFEDNFSIPAATAYQLETGHNGNYKVSITNICGIYTSSLYNLNNATLSVSPFTIIVAGNLPTICPGGTVTLYDNNPYYYYNYGHQWYKDGVAISSANNSSYTVTQPGNYTVAVSANNFSCPPFYSTVFSNWITVTSAAGTYPTINISAAGPTTFCTGGSVVLQSSVTGSAPLSYQWKLNGVNISGASAANYTATASGSYVCMVTNPCSYMTSNGINVTAQTLTASISSYTTNICGSVGVYISCGTQTGNIYQWKLNGSNITGATSSTYYATAGGNYTCAVTNTCGTITSNTITMTVRPTPTAVISGTQTVCSGSQATITINFTGTANWYGYYYYVNNGTTFYTIYNTGSNPFSFNVTPTSSRTYSLYSSYSGDSYCPGSVSGSAVITVIGTAPVAAITPGGSTAFCQGGSVQLNSSTGTGYSYQWKLNTINISGATNSFYIASAAGSYTVVVTNSCGSATSAATAVTVNPLPTASITAGGATTFCSGGNVVLNANTGAGLTWQWKLNTINISGATNSSYIASAAGSFTVVVTNSCASATSAATAITVNPLPNVSFSGLATSYGVTAAAATLTGSPAGGTFSGPGISGTTFTPSIAGVGGPYTIIYSYTDGNGCSNSSSQQTTVLNCIIPAIPASITGATAPCANSTGIAYTCPSVIGATSYTWTVPATATLVSGQGTTSITVNFGASFTSGAISVTADNCAGSSAPKTKNVFGIPATPGTITGQKTGVCAGTVNVAYSINSVGGASTYTWTAPANATIAGGQGTTAVTVNFGATFVSGTLSVTAGNACGTGAAKTATINSKPPVPGAITGPTTFCAYQPGVAYSVTAVNGATAYNWLVPTGAIVATGQGTNSITVNFGNKSGKVKVNAANACGASNYKQLNVTKNCREGLSEPEGDFTVNVYPNPSSGDFVFSISNASNEKISINIYDMIGKLVLSKDFYDSQFIIADPLLIPGSYFAEVIWKENRKAMRLVKIK